MRPEQLAAVLAEAGVSLDPDLASTIRSEALVAEARRRDQRHVRDELARSGPTLVAPDVRWAASHRDVVESLAATIAGQPSAPPVKQRIEWPVDRDIPSSGVSLESHLSGVRIVVTCGAGGVGKTSVSAALAVNRAMAGTNTALLTVDPAHRLATALRLPMVAGEAVSVPLGKGRRLEAMQLDTQRTFDELIDRMAGSADRRDRILSNPFYRRIADTLAGTHEYMAMEKLYELYHEEDHELIVIDTPPTRSALSFLEAPNRLTDFLGGRFLRWMLWPTARVGRFTLSAARFGASAFLRTAGRLIGAEVLADTVDFLASFEGMYGGFKERAEQVLQLLRSSECAFVVVTAPAEGSLEEAGYFVQRLTAAGMRPAAVVVNRWHAESRPLPATAEDALRRLSNGDSPERRAVGAALKDMVAGEPRRAAEARALSTFASAHPGLPLLPVPELPGDVHDTAGLRRVGSHLFGTPERPHS
jgi:anion-transporting  ArsA/GET3 family ATPase